MPPRAALLRTDIKDGFLRIKKGATDFDTEYYFSLQEAAVGGEKGSYTMFFSYAGQGIAYCFLSKPSLIKDKTLTMEDPKYFEVNKEFVPYEVNLWEKKGQLLPMPASSGWAASASVVVGDYVYFGEHPTSGAGFYRYNRKTGKGQQTPSVTMPVAPYLVLDLQ